MRSLRQVALPEKGLRIRWVYSRTNRDNASSVDVGTTSASCLDRTNLLFFYIVFIICSTVKVGKGGDITNAADETDDIKSTRAHTKNVCQLRKQTDRCWMVGLIGQHDILRSYRLVHILHVAGFQPVFITMFIYHVKSRLYLYIQSPVYVKFVNSLQNN